MNKKLEDEKEKDSSFNPWSKGNPNADDYDTDEERIQAEREYKFFKYLQGCAMIGMLMIALFILMVYLFIR